MLKKYWPFLLAAFLLLLLLVWQTPQVQNLALERLNPGRDQVYVYGDFEAFIPYTMGYFPDGFSIKGVGTGAETAPDYDRFQEWYTSETAFIILQETQGEGYTTLPEGEPVTLKDSPAVVISNPDLEAAVNGTVIFEAFVIEEVYQVVMFENNILIEVFTNLPKEEALKIADLLIPSTCLEPPEN